MENVRWLPVSEHERTRPLYEMVFSEDSRRFVDYYYSRIAGENAICVAEEDGAVRAMAHLNPYPVCLYGQECLLHYLVAVATEPAYRHRGMMRRLLSRALEAMFEREEPFTFLMPADENIYRPFGFAWISGTRCQELSPRAYRGSAGLTARRAEQADIPDLAWIGQRILRERYQVFAKRTQAYFERLFAEQEAMKGEVILLEERHIPRGYLVYGAEDGVPEIRELVVEPGYEGQVFGALADCFYYDETIKMYGFPGELALPGAQEKPLMMGRIVHLERFVKGIRAEEEITFEFALTDPLLPQNSGCFRCSVSPERSCLERLERSAGLPELTPAELLNRLLDPAVVFLHETV